VPIAIAVVLHEGFVLVGRREHPPLAGLAEFPGGKVQAGESPEAAAAREVLEESGINVHVERLLASVAADYTHGRLDLRFYLCRPAAATEALPAPAALPPSPETAAGPAALPWPAGPLLPRPPFRWLPLQELEHLDFPPANAAALRALRTLGGG
jgi:8-oxo-dGTP diphosphatase